MKRIVYIACLLVLIACGGQGPQRPSQWLGKSPEPDSAQLRLLEFNQRMTAEADRELIHYVEAQTDQYALFRGGAWVHVIESGDDEKKPYFYGQTCPLHMRIFAMDGQTLLADIRHNCQIGSHDVPYAVTETVRELHPGAKARIIAPWYSAFGIKGYESIQPYQNVIIDLTIEE